MLFSPFQEENWVRDESQMLFLHTGNVAEILLVRMTHNPSHRKPRLASLGHSLELRCDFENFPSDVLKIHCAHQKEK